MHLLIFLIAVMSLTNVRAASLSDWPINQDEAQVAAYVLPDPMRTSDGQEVNTVADWTWSRRPELMKIFEEGMYGKAPSSLS